MRNVIRLAGIGIGLLALSGCAVVAAPLSGSVYTSMTYPSFAGSTAGPGMKRGESTATSILGIVATGDAGVEAAARNGGITKIHTADTKATGILGIYATYTTVVTGE